jgi:hypothetical protein
MPSIREALLETIQSQVEALRAAPDHEVAGCLLVLSTTAEHGRTLLAAVSGNGRPRRRPLLDADADEPTAPFQPPATQQAENYDRVAVLFVRKPDTTSGGPA